MSFTINAGTETLVAKQCGSCGIWFAVPDWHEAEAKRNGPRGGWHCPNGHLRSYTHGQQERDELVRLREQVRTEKDNASFWRSEEQKAQRQVSAHKAAKTRLRKRIEHGVCPHCKRHFENVERHVKSKHPKELVEP